jgi:hypothetical protein
VLGLLAEEPPRSDQSVMGYPILGSVEDLETIVEDHPVDEVIFTVAPDKLADI